MSVIENISFRQGDFTLHLPRLEILDQGVTALKGPSGSGKSTLIRILLGLETAPGWKWVLNEENIAKIPVGRRNFGVVFQSLELFPHLSALDNVIFPLRSRRIPNKEAESRARPLMERLEIWTCKERKPKQLSGGEKQRVALARALVFHPRYVFLDEPFSSLDEEVKKKSRQLVKDVLSDLKVPALLVSHDPMDIEALSSQTHHIKNGRLV